MNLLIYVILIAQIPLHLYGTFMKQKQAKTFINLGSKFVKRFFVFDLRNTRAITYFKNENSTGSPSDVIPLNQIIEVRREQ